MTHVVETNEKHHPEICFARFIALLLFVLAVHV